MLQKIISSDNSKSTIIIRLMIGAVFLSEGIQKFLFPAIRGAGRFEKIGLPSPEFLGAFVIMLVAIGTTKAEILINDEFWVMMHGSRTDWAMLLGSLFLIIKGGGRWSLDKKLSKNG